MPTYRMNVALSWPAGGGPGVSTWHVRNDGTTLGDFDELSGIIDTWYGQVLASGLVPDGYRAQFDGEFVDVDTAEIETGTPWVHQANGAGADFAPLVSQAVFTMRTSVATKAGLGRKFIGPLNRGAVGTDGTLNDALRTTLQGYCDTLVSSSGESANGAIGVYSVTQGIFRDVTAMQCRDYIAVLRSRRD